ncbi:MAG: SHOCT domain-containing protein [Burkholderiales bacterium]|nr:SHOCT domain-containing protein [Burkholderiales bacterium]
MWGDYGMGWGWGFFGVVHMVLWWALLILGIVVLVKWLTVGFGSSRSDRLRESRALEVLKERYARGEIGKEEFEQKKLDLKD